MRCNGLLLIIVLSFFSCENKKKSDVITGTEIIFEQILANSNASSDSLQLVIKNTTNDSLKIEAYNKLFYRKVYSDTVIAQEYYKTLFSIGKKNLYATVRAYNLQGIYLDVKGNYDSALYCYQKSIQLSAGKYPNVEGSAYNNIGLVYWNRGYYAEALSYFNKALQLFEKIENKNLQANALSNIGLIYMDINNPEKSNYYFKTALDKRRELNDEYGISVSLTNLAKSYEMRKKYKEAIPLYDSAILLKEKLNDEIGLSNTRYNQAHCYAQLDSLDKAIELLQRAEQSCIKNGSEANNLTNIFTALGDIYIRQNQPQQLSLLLPKIKSLVDKHKDERNLKEYYQLLSNYNELNNNYKSAFLYNKKADSIYNKLEGIEVKKAINLYETQYQTAKKEKDLANAKVKITEEQLVSKQKNIWLLLLAGIIIIGLVVFRNFQFRAKHRQKQLALENELLQEQNHAQMQAQRLEISRDLHDSLGAQLTFITSTLDSLKHASSRLDETINRKINTLSDFSENSILELKSTLWVLNAAQINLADLKTKILNFIKNASEAKEEVRFKFSFNMVENLSLNSKQAVNLFRAVQEIINNALKYSQATEIKIEVTQTENNLLIIIADNGIGFDYEKEKDKSFGIRNIESRIAASDGKLSVETTPGKGTAYNIETNL